MPIERLKTTIMRNEETCLADTAHERAPPITHQLTFWPGVRTSIRIVLRLLRLTYQMDKRILRVSTNQAAIHVQPTRYVMVRSECIAHWPGHVWKCTITLSCGRTAAGGLFVNKPSHNISPPSRRSKMATDRNSHASVKSSNRTCRCPHSTGTRGSICRNLLSISAAKSCALKSSGFSSRLTRRSILIGHMIIWVPGVDTSGSCKSAQKLAGKCSP